MNEAIHEEQAGRLTIRILPDDDPMNPRTEFDNLGTMVCFHKRYNLGDNEHGLRSCDFTGWDALEEYLEDELDAVVVMPIYMYDHSGITIRTSEFSCPWDSGQIGFIYVERATVLKEYSRKRLRQKMLEQTREILRAEVRVYDAYLSGNACGWIVEDAEGEHLDSCWGYYEMDDALECAREEAKALQEDAA